MMLPSWIATLLTHAGRASPEETLGSLRKWVSWRGLIIAGPILAVLIGLGFLSSHAWNAFAQAGNVTGWQIAPGGANVAVTGSPGQSVTGVEAARVRM
jgi:hypothetical protein